MTKFIFCFLVRNQDLNFCRYLRQVQRLWVRSLWGLEAVELQRDSTALAGLSVPVSPSLLPSHCHFLPMKSQTRGISWAGSCLMFIHVQLGWPNYCFMFHFLNVEGFLYKYVQWERSRNICRTQSCCCGGCGHKDTGCQGSAARPPGLEAHTGKLLWSHLRCELELAESQFSGWTVPGRDVPSGRGSSRVCSVVGCAGHQGCPWEWGSGSRHRDIPWSDILITAWAWDFPGLLLHCAWQQSSDVSVQPPSWFSHCLPGLIAVNSSFNINV